MNKDSKIYIAGHNGLVGTAILENLRKKGYDNFILRTSKELDLKIQADVIDFFKTEKPEYVFLAAAKVGGIMANSLYRTEFIIENLQIQNNVIQNSWLNGVKKLLYLGSSCIYPKNAIQPIKENQLLTSELEWTNEPYSIAKIAGLKLCESYNMQYDTNFISVMPTNLYGPRDNYNLETSHVLPGLIRKIYLAHYLEQNNMNAIRKDCLLHPTPELRDEHSILNFLKENGITKQGNKVTLNLWGTGTPLREFLHVSDMADACVYIMENVDIKDILALNNFEIKNSHINIGSGEEISIRELSELIKPIVGFEGDIIFDNTKPDGTMRKLLDVEKLKNLGWESKIKLTEGLDIACANYKK